MPVCTGYLAMQFVKIILYNMACNSLKKVVYTFKTQTKEEPWEVKYYPEDASFNLQYFPYYGKKAQVTPFTTTLMSLTFFHLSILLQKCLLLFSQPSSTQWWQRSWWMFHTINWLKSCVQFMLTELLQTIFMIRMKEKWHSNLIYKVKVPFVIRLEGMIRVTVFHKVRDMKGENQILLFADHNSRR